MRLTAEDPAAETWAKAMEDAYFTSFTDAEILAHAGLSRRALAEEGAAAEARIRPGLDASEVVVAARDRERLFVDLAAAVTAAGANIVGARVFTSREGQALDVFFVQDVTGQPYGCENPRTLEKLARALEAAARGEAQKGEVRRADFGRSAAFAITPSVMLDNDASEASTVVEASGRDRPGLLVALAGAISDQSLSIVSAHIDNYGERAVDAFYVVDGAGEKLVDAKRRNALKAALAHALDEGEAAANPKSRRNLQRARASVAR